MTANDLWLGILRLAGFVGMDPRPFTFRELFVMAEGKRSEEWIWWSEILALTANCHRNAKKTKAFIASKINPYTNRKKQESSVPEFVQVMKAKHDRIRRIQP